MTGSHEEINSKPDLASILQTLSSFSNPSAEISLPIQGVNVPGIAQIQRSGVDQVSAVRQELNDYDPETIFFTDSGLTELVGAPKGLNEQQSEHVTPNNVLDRTVNLPADSTHGEVIQRTTSWPLALRFTTKLISSSPTIGQRIRTLINNQKLNERQWWEGREALCNMHKARISGRAEIQEVLKSIGAATSAGTDASSDEERHAAQEAAELRTYDAKVYRLVSKMVAEQEKELEALGIPFFASNRNTAERDDERYELRRKMLAFLEDFVE